MSQDIGKFIGRTIRYYRKKKGITQEKLADRSNLGKSTVENAERGNRNLTVFSLCSILFGLNLPPSKKADLSNPEQQEKVTWLFKIFFALSSHGNPFIRYVYENLDHFHQLYQSQQEKKDPPQEP